jgi:hypothetical protein
MGWGIDPEPVTRGRRLSERTIRRVFVTLSLLAISVAVIRPLLGLVFYPLGIASPDMAGIIVSASSTQSDLPEVRLVLASGDEVSLLRTDRALAQGVTKGNLIIVGRNPERWYLTGLLSTAADRNGCFSVWPDRAYSEPDAVVMVFDHWAGSGVRIPTAPGFDDSFLTYDELGHPRYTPFELGSGVSFCLDSYGRVNQFTH